MKTPTKTELKPKAVETLEQIAEAVLAYRQERPSLRVIARIIGRASSLLGINDRDERADAENAATVTLAKKFNLVS